MDGRITAGDQEQAGAGARISVVMAEVEVTPSSRPVEDSPTDKSSQHVALLAAGTRFSPAALVVTLLALLSLGACLAPWFARGWLWFGMTAALVMLLACSDAVALWFARDEYLPVLLTPDKGVRGRQGQTIQFPIALLDQGEKARCREVRVGLMPATDESESAVQVKEEPQWLKLETPKMTEAPSCAARIWPCSLDITLLRRGLWPGPRVGVERLSRLRMWRLRQWFDVPAQVKIEADLRSGRREILRSPIYRALVAAQQTPWTGHGRDFERLREYQPGDNFSEIAWKTTARRGAPVTRLFQWEQKQEVYFVVDQSRASALALGPTGSSDSETLETRAPRRMLDRFVETALVGATVALELGDEFGLVTYADEPKSWLRAGSGRFQFHQLRERLLNIEPLPTNADYEALFAEIRIRLRRRAYLIVLTDIAERTVSDSLRRGVGLVRSSHAVLVTSILPAHAQPAFSAGETLHTDQDVYTALAGEKENQRLGALARQLSQLDVRLRYVPQEKFLRTAVEGYLEGKREQRL